MSGPSDDALYSDAKHFLSTLLAYFCNCSPAVFLPRLAFILLDCHLTAANISLLIGVLRRACLQLCLSFQYFGFTGVILLEISWLGSSTRTAGLFCAREGCSSLHCQYEWHFLPLAFYLCWAKQVVTSSYLIERLTFTNDDASSVKTNPCLR